MAHHLTRRQLQAIAQPCPTVEFQADPCLHTLHEGRTPEEKFGITFWVGPMNQRIYWFCAVSRIVGGDFVPLQLCSQTDCRAMNELANSMFVSKSRTGNMDGPPVGAGKFEAAPGKVSFVLYRAMTGQEAALLDKDWEKRILPKFPKPHLLGETK